VSIKIYEAYRVKRGVDPYELLWDLKRQAQAAAKERLAKVFHDILDGRSHEAWTQVEEENRLFTAWLNEHHPEAATGTGWLGLYRAWITEHCPPELKRPEDLIAVSNQEVLELSKRTHVEGDKPGVFDIDSWAHKSYGKTLAQHTWDLWAIDTSITMRVYRGKYYLIPYFDRRCHLSGLLDFMADDERLEEFGYWNNTDKPDEVSTQKWAWRRTVWNDLTKHERWKEYVSVDIISWLGWSDVTPMMEVAQTRNAKLDETAVAPSTVTGL